MTACFFPPERHEGKYEPRWKNFLIKGVSTRGNARQVFVLHKYAVDLLAGR